MTLKEHLAAAIEHRLPDRTPTTIFARAEVRRATLAGTDIIVIEGDIAMQDRIIMGPERWRALDKPRLAAMLRVCREINPRVYSFFHSDGDLTEVMEDLIEIGFPDHRLHPARVHGARRDRGSLRPAVDPARLWKPAARASLRDSGRLPRGSQGAHRELWLRRWARAQTVQHDRIRCAPGQHPGMVRCRHGV